MIVRSILFIVGITGVFTLWAIAVSADDAKQPGFGANPTLPAPQSNLVPTVKVAPAVGWPDNQKPGTPSDLTVSAYASGLDHPRWIYTLPNGDVLVAERTGPNVRTTARASKHGFRRCFRNMPEQRCKARIASRCCGD